MNDVLKRRPFAAVSLLLLGVGLLAGLPLRLYQLMTLIAQDTGFYTVKSHWSTLTLYLIAGVVSVLAVAFCFFAKDVPLEDLQKKKNPTAAVGGALCAAGLFAEFILQLIGAFNQFTSSAETWGMTQLSAKAGGVLLFVHSALALAACFYFLLYTCTMAGNGLDYRNFPVLALMPSIWMMLRLIERFLQPFNYRNVSEVLLELFGWVFLLLFLWYFARVSSNVDAKGKMSRCYAFGIPAVLFLLISSAPRLILLLCGMKRFLVTGSPVQWCDLGAAAFVLCYLFSGLKEAGKQRIAK